MKLLLISRHAETSGIRAGLKQIGLDGVFIFGLSYYAVRLNEVIPYACHRLTEKNDAFDVVIVEHESLADAEKIMHAILDVVPWQKIVVVSELPISREFLGVSCVPSMEHVPAAIEEILQKR